MSKSNKNMPET